MIYNVRIREIRIYDFDVESDDLKSAFLTAMKKAHSKKFKVPPLGRFFELEHISVGGKNERVNTDPGTKRKPKNKKVKI